MATGKVTVFHGSFVHSTYEYPAVYLTNHTLAIQDGKIIYFGDKQLFDKQHMQFDQTPEVYTMRDREFLIPGLIDAHLHAPQFVNMGCALDKPLMEWLTAYTFPTEAKFSDLQYAKHIYETVVKGVLRNGTTTASYFATIHTDATLVLCDVIEKLGQRSFVGKVNMDSHSPNYYVEDTDKSIEETERFVQEVMARNNKLLTPVISPRFALSCSAKLMMALGNIAKKYDLPIQSHICENKCEIQTVLEAFSVCSCYSEIYEKLGLLTNRSYLAHGVYLSDKELGILKETGTGIVHCPNSNISLCSGLCDVQRLLNAGIKVGLGTDISGGFSPSMLDAIRCAVQTSKIISFDQVNYDILSHEVAFSLATLGNSHVLGLQNQIGNFEVGKEFDAILVDATFPNIPSEIDAKEELKDLFQRFIYTGDDRNLEKIYVAGKVVAGASVKPNAI